MSDTTVTAKEALQSIVDHRELPDEVRFSAQESIRQIERLEDDLKAAENRVQQGAEHEARVVRETQAKSNRIANELDTERGILENLPRFWGRKKRRNGAMDRIESLANQLRTPESE